MKLVPVVCGLAVGFLLALLLIDHTQEDVVTPPPAPVVTITQTCTPIPDDTDQPLPSGAVACGG